MLIAGAMTGVTAATDTLGTSVNSSGNLQVDNVGARAVAVGTRTVASAGMSTALQGGSFQDNLTASAILSGASEAYLDTVGRSATGVPGVASDSPKYDPNPDGTPPLVNGQERNVIGFNNDSGCITCQQSTLGNIVNAIPGGNNTGLLHDTWMNRIEKSQGSPATTWQNIGTMAPAAIIALPATYDQSGLRYVIPPVIEKNNQQQNQNTGSGQ